VDRVRLSVPSCEATVPSTDLRIDTLASGLEVPWDVVFLSDGRALLTERPGRVRVLAPDGSLRSEPWAELDVVAPRGSEAGLLGIDARELPGSPPEIFVTSVVGEPSESLLGRLVTGARNRVRRLFDPERGHDITFRVTRLVDRGGEGGDATVLVDSLPSFPIHGGGTIRLGPDGLLYVSNGDGAEPPRAQAPGSTRGKILRYAPDGSIPASNPVPGSPVFASGVRHVQGLAWLDSGELLAIDHGPTGLPAEAFRTDADELTVVHAGANLGWPLVTGATTGDALASPIMVWTPAVAPAGLAVYRGEAREWAGSVFVTSLRGVSLRRLRLDRSRDGTVAVACEEVLLRGAYGRLRLVRMAPDGTLWLGTSNHDGRGAPRPGDDLVLRLHPPT
jgi:quinoprotein glucose dehydrogenase